LVKPRVDGDAGDTPAPTADMVRTFGNQKARAGVAAGVSRDPHEADNAGARRLKVLLSAYACEPGRGSEPGVGWHVVVEAARHHDVWAITRANNRAVIEADLARNPIPGLHLVYYDLPRWARWWKRGPRGTRLYYYLWQLAVYPLARREHRRIGFDLAHHVTFVKYWMPSLLPFLPVPFLWGPVGGGESAPKSFQVDFDWYGRLYEMLRSLVRRCGESDPLVSVTARRSALALAVTRETAQRLEVIGAKRVEIFSEAGLSEADRSYLDSLSSPGVDEPVRFLSLGNLLHLKGFHLGLRAFAAANLPRSEYWLVGDGPYRAYLERLTRRLGIEDKVRFWGLLPRREALAKLGSCHMLVHPSLHDSGGWVCLEAMAAGRPVLCLDLGGPGAQVTSDTGFKISARDPDAAVKDMAEVMAVLAYDPGLRVRMGQAGKERVATNYAWERKGKFLATLYEELVGTAQRVTAKTAR
jgi:glycosyltransferase involved in cell wall biosynthesis